MSDGWMNRYIKITKIMIMIVIWWMVWMGRSGGAACDKKLLVILECFQQFSYHPAEGITCISHHFADMHRDSCPTQNAAKILCQTVVPGRLRSLVNPMDGHACYGPRPDPEEHA